MDAKYITTVGLRLFAVWICVGAFQIFSMLESLKKSGMTIDQSPWVSLSVVGVAISMALILWILSRPIARLLTFDLRKPSSATQLSTADLVVAGCVLMGLWWLKNSLLPFIEFWLRAVARASYSGDSALATLDNNDKISVALNLLQIGVALLFICRPRRITQWVLGRSTTPVEPPSEAN